MLELANGELTVAWVRGMTYLKKNVVLRSAQRTFTSPGPWPLNCFRVARRLFGPERFLQPFRAFLFGATFGATFGTEGALVDAGALPEMVRPRRLNPHVDAPVAAGWLRANA